MNKNKEIPYIVKVLMYIGFHIILIFGVLNKFIFNPRSAGNKYKKVRFELFS